MKKEKLLCVLVFLAFIITGCDRKTSTLSKTKSYTSEINEAGMQQPPEKPSLQEAGVQTPFRYTSISNALSRMEYPEYRTFISRYELVRNEQVVLLEDSIRRNRLEVDVSNSHSLNNAGYTLYENKDYIGAVRFLREAAYIDPANVYAHYNLVRCLSLIKEKSSLVESERWGVLDYEEAWLEETTLYSTKMLGNIANEYSMKVMLNDEIYDHLTLTFLLDRSYMEKSQNDRSLDFITRQKRFKALLQNIQTERFKNIHGAWITDNHGYRVVYFMLDQRFCHVDGDGNFLSIPFIYYNAGNDDDAFLIKTEYFSPDPSIDSGYVLTSTNDAASMIQYDFVNEDFFLSRSDMIYIPPYFSFVEKMETKTYKIPFEWLTDTSILINNGTEYSNTLLKMVIEGN